MAHPTVAIYVRCFGMSGLIGKAMGFSLGLRTTGLRWSGTCRRRAPERSRTALRRRAGVEIALGCVAPAGLSAAFLRGDSYCAKEQQHR
jgi:hypothetical protein